MTAAACRVPDELAEADLWDVLASAVCRCSKERVQHLLVDDSKKVYRAGQGLADLECTALAVLAEGGRPATLAELLARVGSATELAEPWYRCVTTLPRAVEGDRLAEATAAFDRACREA